MPDDNSNPRELTPRIPVQVLPTYEPKINRLPPEILAKILEYRILDQDLVAATHVCRYWRSTLISTACLWTRVECCNSDSVCTHLERSKTAPIDVLAIYISSSPLHNPALEQCIPHLGRVRSMIYLPPGNVLPAIYKFRSPTPLLQRLEISGPWCDGAARLPDDFLGRHAPSLRYLRLLGSTPLMLKPFPLPNLTDLTLFAAEPRAPTGPIYELLSSAPRLRNVSIVMVREAMDETPIPDIHLGSLRCLKVISGSTLSRAIPHIKAPELEELVLRMSSGMEVATIKELLPPESYPLMTEVTSMDLRSKPGGSGDTEITLKGKGTKVSLMTYFLSPAALHDFFPNTASCLFAQITRLKLRFGAGPLASRIVEFENLERIELERCAGEDVILEALCPSPPPSSGSVPWVPCSHLEVMRVDPCSPQRPTLENLVRMARSRKEAGCPLERIDVPSLLSEDKKMLSESLGKDHVLGL